MPDMAENTEGKRKFALWIRESSLEQVRKWYKADDCSSQSEFIEKAIHFYIGYISSENGSDYLPKIITSTVKGIVNDSDNRISRILFKLAVEQAITMNVVAATCNIGREQLEKLRGTCVAQVKRSNGVYSFEDAFDFQKRYINAKTGNKIQVPEAGGGRQIRGGICPVYCHPGRGGKNR